MPFEGRALYAEKRWRGFESILKVLCESSLCVKDQQVFRLAGVRGEGKEWWRNVLGIVSRSRPTEVSISLDAVRDAGLVSLIITGCFV
jgi:hypothetical protein